MALEKNTNAQFRLVECTSALDADGRLTAVPFVAGQYIVHKTLGLTFYDPSNGTSVADRIQLSSDLSDYLTKAEGKVGVFELVVSTDSDDDTQLATLTDAKHGDFAICKHAITDALGADAGDFTAYINVDGVWKALSGNINAKNVYFSEDLMTTSAIGNISLSNGQATIPAAGSNLEDVWNSIFVKEANTGLTTGNPAAGISAKSDNIQYLIVGNSASRDITVSLSSVGSYKYGYTTQDLTEGQPATSITTSGTGVAVNTSADAPYALTYGGTSVSPKTTKGNVFTVDSGIQTSITSVKAKGTVAHTQGGIPVSNLKKAYPSQRIAAGTKSTSEVELFRWYMPMYHGFTYNTTTIADITKVTAAEVSALSMESAATCYAKTKRTSDTASASWQQYVIAVPSAWNWNLSAAKDGNNLTLQVNKGNTVDLTFGTAKVTYQIFYINNAALYDTKAISLTW